MSDPALTAMMDALYAVVRGQSRKHQATAFRWTLTVGNTTVSGDTTMLLITDAQKVTLAIQPIDSHGHPARIDGLPEWGMSDTSLGMLDVSADGLSAVFTSGDALGLVQINVSADADLGGGVRTISGSIDIQVEAGEAVSLGITAGVPEPK